ncbi:MAG TPA: hypothetical protein GXZ43_04465 [Clostridiaceae bacterium]|nr:hypothetical protein [Clostridiaceae bacterium]
MKQLMRSLKSILLFFIIISLFLLVGIVLQQNKSQRLLLQSSNENKAVLHSRYSNAGTIWSSDMVRLAYSKDGERLYAENPELARAMVQTIGDYTHNIGNTVEGAYQDRLIGAGRSVIQQLAFDFTGNGMTGDDIILTVNSDLTLHAQSLLGDANGSIVIINYKTGAILCMVSTPNTYPDNVITWTDIPESSLFNRSISGAYSPGSTYKIVTGIAWTESEQYDPNYTMYCKGQEPLLGQGSVTEDRGEDAHGEIGMQTAYHVSCNHFFGDIGIKTGSELMLDTAEQFGFNKSLLIGRLIGKTGTYKAADNDQYLLSWQSIGQPIDQNELTVSPLHLAMISGAIANQGVMMQPYLIKNFISPFGKNYESTKQEVFSQLDSTADIEIIKNNLISTVEQGRAYGSYIPGYAIGGKTGTAESINNDGELASNSLYTGFIDDPGNPYSVGIVIENGFYDTPAIAGSILAKVIELNLPY